MQGLGASQHCRQGLDGAPDQVDVWLLGGEGHPGGLSMESQHHRPRVLSPKTFLHDLCPHAPGGAELGYFLEEVVLGDEKEGDPGSELVHREPGPDRRLHVSDRVGEGESQLLHGRGSGLSHVVSADADGVPARDAFGAKLEHVHHQTHRRARWIGVGPPGDVFL